MELDLIISCDRNPKDSIRFDADIDPDGGWDIIITTEYEEEGDQFEIYCSQEKARKIGDFLNLLPQ